MTRRFARLAWLAATCTYLLIILGAIVRITGSGVRRALAALQRSAAAAPRPADRDRVRAPARRGGGERARDCARDVRLVAAAPPSTALHRPPPPGGGGLRRACVTRRAGPARRRHREAE